jgi:hypothetical protein
LNRRLYRSRRRRGCAPPGGSPPVSLCRPAVRALPMARRKAHSHSLLRRSIREPHSTEGSATVCWRRRSATTASRRPRSRRNPGRCGGSGFRVRARPRRRSSTRAMPARHRLACCAATSGQALKRRPSVGATRRASGSQIHLLCERTLVGAIRGPAEAWRHGPAVSAPAPSVSDNVVAPITLATSWLRRRSHENLGRSGV